MSKQNMCRLPLVVILGATGAGKSKLALEIAVKYNGEIISADSMQVYKKLDIITNKVTPAERALCPHHLIDCVSPLNTAYSVVHFRNTALPLIDAILARDRLPVVVGGTNYYIEALLWKLLVDDGPTKENPADKETKVLPPDECHSKPETLSPPPGECPVQTEAKRRRLSDPEGPTPEVDQKQHSNCKLDEDRLNNSNDTNRTDVRPPELDHPSPPDPECSQGFDRASLDHLSPEALYQRLCEVDPDRARQLHPNNSRKVLRSLEVYYSSGERMSHILRQQHAGTDGVSGPLRYQRPCVIWVQSDQSVLDTRTDKRVDQMMTEGLIREMTDFHTEYNQTRLRGDSEADYTLGIFQSIGFKEFHDYLIMTEEERASERGQAALRKGTEDMKRATRQYARRQGKWMTNRFLKRRGGSVPSVYAVDSTDPSLWQERVHQPAVSIVDAFIQGREPPVAPLPPRENENLPVYERCEACGVVLLTSQQWNAHLNSRKHKKNVQRKNRLKGKPEESPDKVDRSKLCDVIRDDCDQLDKSVEHPPKQCSEDEDTDIKLEPSDKNTAIL